MGASGLTPNLTDGGGPVFCGVRGVAVGCCGIGGTGGGLLIEYELVPKPFAPVG